MPRQYQPLEIKSFSKGLITEASPLSFPQDASIDELNFEINNDGSRSRRRGIDLEEGYFWRSPFYIPDSAELSNFNSVLWENAGGKSEKSLLVIQVGTELMFFHTDKSNLSSGYIRSHNITDADRGKLFDMSVIDSYLVVATGGPQFRVFEYDGTTVTISNYNLLIRDTFGLADYDGSINIREGTDVTRRPSPTLTVNHRYNLRNQSFGLPRDDSDGNTNDPIKSFRDDAGAWPSNADSVFDAYYEDVSSDTPQAKRYYPGDLKSGPLGSFSAPKGFFVIDALKRGESRLAEYNRLMANNPELIYSIDSLPTDRTDGGASCVSQYGGRVWFGGFEGEVTQPDEYSPDLSSYLLYSRLVRSRSDINKCYQESDPAGFEAPDLIDTDGGFLRIDGASDIKRMFNVGRGLIVLASNGIWMVSGGSDYGFSATNNKVTKISEKGTDNPLSCVVVDNSVLYWSDDGIYHIRPNQFGDYESVNITKNTVQRFYDSIPSVNRVTCQGNYDSFSRKIRWVYDNTFDYLSNSLELILDIEKGAFSRNSFNYSSNTPLKVVSPIKVPPYAQQVTQTFITHNGQNVLDDGEQVTSGVSTLVNSSRDLKYLVGRVIAGKVELSFSQISDDSFNDWRSYDGVGSDSEAYLVTGWVSGGDNIRMKQAPYLIMHMERTETGFYSEGDSLYPLNPSGCLVRPQWDWTNSPNSGKWGTPFQVYRYKRPYFSTGTQDSYDTGDKLIVTKSKLRGRGRVLSLDIRTEPGKDCHIYGWGMIIGANGNV